MRQDLIVSQSIDVNAPASKVWEALTKPEIIKEYLFGTETLTDWRPGSEIFFQGEYEGKTYRDKGIILAMEPEKLISYSYWSAFTGLADLPENYSTVTYTLSHPHGPDSTTFNWTQEGFASEDGYHHSKDGMSAFLEQIKEIMER
jgi:uncharacterized protein YndB with AHSA1/START domain